MHQKCKVKCNMASTSQSALNAFDLMDDKLLYMYTCIGCRPIFVVARSRALFVLFRSVQDASVTTSKGYADLDRCQ